jgi:hypothetical protein
MDQSTLLLKPPDAQINQSSEFIVIGKFRGSQTIVVMEWDNGKGLERTEEDRSRSRGNIWLNHRNPAVAEALNKPLIFRTRLVIKRELRHRVFHKGRRKGTFRCKESIKRRFLVKVPRGACWELEGG